MKDDKMLGNVAKALSDVEVGGRKQDPELAALDRGILEVALMIAGLDGIILPAEFAAFGEMAKKCRGATVRNTKALFDAAVGKAGRISAMAQSGLYAETARLATFVRMANDALPKGFASGSVADLRRAFALWVAMGVSDGTFSGFEEKCVRALVRRFALSRAAKVKRFHPLVEPEFFAKAKKIFRDMAVDSKRAKAEAELSDFIGTVAVKAKTGMTLHKSAGISLAAPVPGPTVPGWR